MRLAATLFLAVFVMGGCVGDEQALPEKRSLTFAQKTDLSRPVDVTSLQWQDLRDGRITFSPGPGNWSIFRIPFTLALLAPGSHEGQHNISLQWIADATDAKGAFIAHGQGPVGIHGRLLPEPIEGVRESWQSSLTTCSSTCPLRERMWLVGSEEGTVTFTLGVFDRGQEPDFAELRSRPLLAVRPDFQGEEAAFGLGRRSVDASGAPTWIKAGLLEIEESSPGLVGASKSITAHAGMTTRRDGTLYWEFGSVGTGVFTRSFAVQSAERVVESEFTTACGLSCDGGEFWVAIQTVPGTLQHQAHRELTGWDGDVLLNGFEVEWVWFDGRLDLIYGTGWIDSIRTFEGFGLPR